MPKGSCLLFAFSPVSLSLPCTSFGVSYPQRSQGVTQLSLSSEAFPSLFLEVPPNIVSHILNVPMPHFKYIYIFCYEVFAMV